MKSIKLIVLSLIAIFALGAFVAATASAEEGFLPTPTLANVLGGTSTLATPTAGSSIICAKLDETHILFLPKSDNHATGTLHWLGCKAGGLFAANSLGDGKEEILVPVLFLVCLDPKNSEGKLIDEFGIIGLVIGTVHLEAVAAGVLVEVLSQALGAVLTTGKVKLFIIEFAGSKGAQTVTECLVEGKPVKHNLESGMNHPPTYEKASENVEGGLVQFPEAVELMDK